MRFFGNDVAEFDPKYLHEKTVFPNGKHDDQADSTAPFLDWFKKPFASQGYYEWLRMEAERLDNPQTDRERHPVLLEGPVGMSVQTLSGRHLNVGSSSDHSPSFRQPLPMNGSASSAESSSVPSRTVGHHHPRPHAPGWRGWVIDHRHDSKPW
jgi:hypothetical protein